MGAGMTMAKHRLMLNEPHLETAQSDGILTLNTDMRAPLNALRVDFEPVQSGSGDPSPENVRPITGWNGARIEIAAEAHKLYPTDGQTRWESSGIVIDYVGNGKYRIHGQRTGTVALPTIPVEPFIIPSGDGRRFDMCNSNANMGVYIYFKSATGSNVDYWVMNPANRSSLTYIAMAGETIAGFVITCTANNSIDFTFEPTFSKNKTSTVPISWTSEAGTVYKGHAVINRDGLATVTATMASVDAGSLTWGAYNAPYGKCFYGTPPTPKHGWRGLSSDYVQHQIGFTQIENGEFTTGSGAGYAIFVRDDRYTSGTTQEFKAAMQGVQFVYELDTPVTYTLTPQEVLRTLRGENNLWSDANGAISATFWKH